MKKRLVALVLVLTFCLAFTTGGYASSADNSKVQHLVMTFFAWTGAPADVQKVQDAINAITVPKYGIELELQITDPSSYRQTLTLALSSGQQVDIASTILPGYVALQTQGYLLDLEKDDLLKTYGSGIADAVGQANIDACRINGVLYGLPTNCDAAVGRGCVAIADKYLTGIGYAVPSPKPDEVKITLDELQQMLDKLHETYPDKEVIRPIVAGYQQFLDVDRLGGNFFGTLLAGGQELKVENLFTSDAYKNYCKMVYDWNQKGFVSKDASTDSTPPNALCKADKLMAYTTGGKPGASAAESALCGQGVTVFQTGSDVMDSSAMIRFPWAIPITSANPAKAMTMLNAFYTDPELANLLIFGVEGTHYVVKADGTIDYPEGTTGAASGWNLNLGWMMPNQYISHVWAGNDPDLYANLKAFNDGAIRSKALGFTFDGTNISTELAAVQNVYDEFQKGLELGFVDPATGIQQMVDKMNASGLDTIISEKQKQLDAWVAATMK